VPEEKIGQADRENMYGWIYAFLEHFADHLRPELASAWKIRFGNKNQS